MVDVTWKKYEKDLHSDKADISIKASDAFEKERKLQLETSKAARDWEKGRKEDNAKQKPQWVQNRLKKEKQEITDFNKNLHSWTGFKSELKPTPNYLIVFVNEREEKTESGLFLASGDDFLKNDGTCIDIGGTWICPFNPQVIEPPCKAGDHILFKKGAGIDIQIKDTNYKFMTFQDVLAIFKDE